MSGIVPIIIESIQPRHLIIVHPRHVIKIVHLTKLMDDQRVMNNYGDGFSEFLRRLTEQTSMLEKV